MSIDDRFEDLAAALGGFYRTWFIDIGLELGLFAAIRAAGDEGLTPDDLAARTETHASITDSHQPTHPGESLMGSGKSPRRLSRQMVGRLNPIWPGSSRGRTIRSPDALP